MLCCLNPICHNPPSPDGTKFCFNCGVSLVTLRNRYRPIKPLGSGGFSKTYLASDTDKLNEKCVIKQLAPQIQGTHGLQKATELFEQEARRLQQLGEHVQIPTLLAYFHENNHLYLVQQFIDGQNLLDELEQNGNFSEQKIRELLLNFLSILKIVHQQKVIHRDIKPENIMRRHDGNLVLIDFGASKQLLATVISQTKKGTMIGSFGYVAMEQMQDGEVYPASDLYSLGATCFHLLSGINPWELWKIQGYGWVANWRQSLQQPVSKELALILDKLLKVNYQERYQLAEDVLQDLNLPSSNTNINPPVLKLSQFKFEVITVNDVGKPINKSQRSVDYFIEDLGNGTGIEMIVIPGGTFMMGSPKYELGCADSETPQHRVTIQPFFMGKYPITQEQWAAVAALPKVKMDLNINPSNFKGANLPVEKISWWQANEFCARLLQHSKRKAQNKNQRIYRLPSEAEWEYACRAGTITPFYFGSAITVKLANYNGNYAYGNLPKGKYRQKTTPVNSFPPNAFGLYDMHGNVLEWCQDSWHHNYNLAPTDGSAWVDNGSVKLVRGGSWYESPLGCSSAARFASNSNEDYDDVGFRVVCDDVSITA